MSVTIYSQYKLDKTIEYVKSHKINTWYTIRVSKSLRTSYQPFIDAGFVRCNSYEKGDLKQFALFICGAYAHTVPTIGPYNYMVKVAVILKLENNSVLFTRSTKVPNCYYPLTKPAPANSNRKIIISRLLEEYGIVSSRRIVTLSKRICYASHPFDDSKRISVLWYTYCAVIEDKYANDYELINADEVVKKGVYVLRYIPSLEKKIINC